MAVSSNPDLLEVIAELGTDDTDLVGCIASAGKTGVWTSLLDFAGYSAIPPGISITPNIRSYEPNEVASNTQYESEISSDEDWTSSILSSEELIIKPGSGNAGINNIEVAPKFINSGVGTLTSVIRFTQVSSGLSVDMTIYHWDNT